MEYIIVQTSSSKLLRYKGKIIYFHSPEEAYAFTNSFQQYAINEAMLSGDIHLIMEVMSTQYIVNGKEDLTEDEVISIDNLRL